MGGGCRLDLAAHKVRSVGSRPASTNAKLPLLARLRMADAKTSFHSRWQCSWSVVVGVAVLSVRSSKDAWGDPVLKLGRGHRDVLAVILGHLPAHYVDAPATLWQPVIKSIKLHPTHNPSRPQLLAQGGAQELQGRGRSGRTGICEANAWHIL